MFSETMITPLHVGSMGDQRRGFNGSTDLGLLLAIGEYYRHIPARLGYMALVEVI